MGKGLKLKVRGQKWDFHVNKQLCPRPLSVRVCVLILVSLCKGLRQKNTSFKMQWLTKSDSRKAPQPPQLKTVFSDQQLVDQITVV